jgi:hypothetical protein
VPALMMRGRYLMREYWSDSDLFLKLKAEQREVYQGLWMLADDAGWLPRDVPAIAASLFRYEDRAPRENRIRDALDRLRVIGKVESHRCGCLYLKSVSRYPRAGKKTTEHAEIHRAHSNGFKPTKKDLNPSHQKDLNPSPVPSSSLPDVAGARAPAGAAPDETEFQRRVPRITALGGRL